MADGRGVLLLRLDESSCHQSVPLGGAFWDAGAEVFIHKGVNGRWTDVLSREEAAEYEARAVQELGPECARWIATGQGLD